MTGGQNSMCYVLCNSVFGLLIWTSFNNIINKMAIYMCTMVNSTGSHGWFASVGQMVA